MGIDQFINSWTAIFPLTVLFYYFFRKRYESKTISSTLFWQQDERELQVSPYLRNLQRNALFYLQMAALLVMVFLLLKPYVMTEKEVADETIFIIDTSASMLATKNGVTHFDHQRAEMKTVVEKRAGQPMTIVTSGKEPAIVVQKETDPKVIIGAIDQLQITYENEQMAKTIEFVQSLATKSGSDIHIYTDYLDRSTFYEGEPDHSWTVHGLNDAVVNISIDKFGALQATEGTEAIVKIVNQSDQQQSGKIEIFDALSDQRLASENFTIEASKELFIPFEKLPTSNALHAEMIVNDEYEVDNHAFSLVGNEEKEVIVDRSLHELIYKAFEAVGAVVSTGSVNEMRLHAGAFAVTNDVSLLEKSEQPILLIGRNDVSATESKGAIETSSDPLFMLVNLEDVYVQSLYPPFNHFTTIADIDGKPFIQRSGRGDLIVLADIDQTDWPLHPSFPLFIWSVSETFTAEQNSLGLFTPNERKAILMSGLNELEVFTIQDEYIATYRDGSNFIAPSRPGIYKVADGKEEKRLVVQLEQVEKELQKGTSYRIGQLEEQQENEQGKKGIGWILLIPILMLLLIEWEVQRRRGVPN
ncbi:BatA and WFA domain-containing protein [Sporosarcina sp. HYO08]|uniref:vWA domain-containing protein n=1 Tax=Sporosarcina sp. HYO08 TaxID=1759557 RepID=UPI000799EE7C|nr:BatA and WFA domain-containing protein [Sporosarcina sp. HYO08]KXH79831.1 hypothetical protein AU377_10135 [Sporosarcina sp. HYO08]